MPYDNRVEDPNAGRGAGNALLGNVSGQGGNLALEAPTDTLFNKILELGSDTTLRMQQKQNAQDRLRGQARVAQGASMQEIRATQPMSQRIFGGGATVEGALAMAVQKSTDDYFTETVRNMQKHREQRPDDFAAAQIESITAHLTGDEQADSMILAAGDKVISELSRVQFQEHMKYVQEVNKTAYDGVVSSATTKLVAQTANPNATDEDKKSALDNLYKAIAKPPTMDAAAYKASLVTAIVNERKLGYDSILGMAREQGVAFEIEHEAAIFDSESVRNAAVRERDTIEYEQWRGKLQTMDNLEVPISELIAFYIEGLNRWGKDLAGEGYLGNILEQRLKNIEGKAKFDDFSELYLLGRGTEILEAGDRVVARRLGNAKLDAMVADGRITREWADGRKMELWGRTMGDIDPDLKLSWDTYLGTPTAAGVVTPEFQVQFRDFKKHYSKYPDRADAHIGDPGTKQMLHAVMDWTAMEGMDVQQAVNTWRAKKDTRIPPEALYSKDVQSAVTDEIDSLLASDWGNWFTDADNREASKNDVFIKAALGRLATDQVGRTGIMDGSAKVALSKFKTQYAVLGGGWVRTEGVSFETRMGLDGTEATGKVALDTYLTDQGTELFGPEFNKKHVRYSFDPRLNQLLVVPQDSDGNDKVLAGTYAMKPIPMEQIGTYYKDNILQIKRKSAERAAALREEGHQAKISFIQQISGMTSEEADAHLQSTEGSIHKFLTDTGRVNTLFNGKTQDSIKADQFRRDTKTAADVKRASTPAPAGILSLDGLSPIIN